MKQQKILYLHGFLSSSQSVKARQTYAYFQQNYPEIEVVIPQLATEPAKVVKQLIAIVEATPDCLWSFMGSSLGGYFASFLAERYRAKAVLINPAIKPYQLLTDYLGEQQNPSTGERFVVSPMFISDLKALEPKQIVNANNYLVLLQTGDEVLDYRQAVERYKHAQLDISEGGDHAYVNYADKLADVVKFFQFA